jgi:FKBP-type peptidyl-prolyl cis-trans isomerase 2
MKRVLSRLAPSLLVVAIIGCAAATVTDKKMVQMNYKGTLADGTVFGQSEPGKPLEFMVGAGRMIPTLEAGIRGLKVGGKKKIEIKAADAYGDYDKNAIQEIPRGQFPAGVELAAGQYYRVQSPQGPLTVSIIAVKAATVTVDFNHPLAGKDLSFDIEIVRIRDATKAELAEAFPPAADSPAQPAAAPASK